MYRFTKRNNNNLGEFNYSFHFECHMVILKAQ
jgi:hypothetical protein